MEEARERRYPGASDEAFYIVGVIFCTKIINKFDVRNSKTPAPVFASKLERRRNEGSIYPLTPTTIRFLGLIA